MQTTDQATRQNPYNAVIEEQDRQLDGLEKHIALLARKNKEETEAIKERIGEFKETSKKPAESQTISSRH